MGKRGEVEEGTKREGYILEEKGKGAKYTRGVGEEVRRREAPPQTRHLIAEVVCVFFRTVARGGVPAGGSGEAGDAPLRPTPSLDEHPRGRGRKTEDKTACLGRVRDTPSATVSFSGARQSEVDGCTRQRSGDVPPDARPFSQPRFPPPRSGVGITGCGAPGTDWTGSPHP